MTPPPRERVAPIKTPAQTVPPVTPFAKLLLAADKRVEAAAKKVPWFGFQLGFLYRAILLVGVTNIYEASKPKDVKTKTPAQPKAAKAKGKPTPKQKAAAKSKPGSSKSKPCGKAKAKAKTQKAAAATGESSKKKHGQTPYGEVPWQFWNVCMLLMLAQQNHSIEYFSCEAKKEFSRNFLFLDRLNESCHTS